MVERSTPPANIRAWSQTQEGRAHMQEVMHRKENVAKIIAWGGTSNYLSGQKFIVAIILPGGG